MKIKNSWELRLEKRVMNNPITKESACNSLSCHFQIKALIFIAFLEPLYKLWKGTL